MWKKTKSSVIRDRVIAVIDKRISDGQAEYEMGVIDINAEAHAKKVALADSIVAKITG
jgi:hypothetical protein